MSVRPVRELPPRTRGGARGESYVSKDVREFVRNGWEIAVVEHEGKKTRQVAAALRKCVSAGGRKLAGISVVQRGDKVYLVREVQR